MVRRIEGPEWLRCGDVAALFGVPPRIIRQWAGQGRFPAAGGGGKGRHMRWRRAIVEDVLNQNWSPATGALPSPVLQGWPRKVVTMFDEESNL